jgi:hypothetical protein
MIGLGIFLVVLFIALIRLPILSIVQPLERPPSIQQAIHVQSTGDNRYDRAPQPLRDWMATPEYPPRGGIATIPINIPTQGLPESFQSIGIINVGEQILPLYGRRTAGSSDRWNYYTRTDTYNPVPIPVQYERRNCMDSVGCGEIFSGETVHIKALKKEGTADVYKFDGPTYIPGLV